MPSELLKSTVLTQTFNPSEIQESIPNCMIYALEWLCGIAVQKYINTNITKYVDKNHPMYISKYYPLQHSDNCIANIGLHNSLQTIENIFTICMHSNDTFSKLQSYLKNENIPFSIFQYTQLLHHTQWNIIKILTNAQYILKIRV